MHTWIKKTSIILSNEQRQHNIVFGLLLLHERFKLSRFHPHYGISTVCKRKMLLSNMMNTQGFGKGIHLWVYVDSILLIWGFLVLLITTNETFTMCSCGTNPPYIYIERERLDWIRDCLTKLANVNDVDCQFKFHIWSWDVGSIGSLNEDLLPLEVFA